MPPESVFVTLHVHTDGPIPGPHSLLTLASVAQPRIGGPISTFTANVRELAGATFHPRALHQWQSRPEDWLASRRASRPPSAVMAGYLRWVADLPARPVLVAEPAGAEQLFLYWYLHRFSGCWPFAGIRAEAGSRSFDPFDPREICPLAGCRLAPVELARSS